VTPCQDVREQLSALLDDAVAPATRAALEAHLGTCPDCRRELEALRATSALLGRLAPVRAPAGFVDRVMGSAYPRSWPRRLRDALFVPLRVKLPLEAAAVALVAVLAVTVHRQAPEVQRRAGEDLAARAPATSPPPASGPGLAPAPPADVGTPTLDDAPAARARSGGGRGGDPARPPATSPPAPAHGAPAESATAVPSATPEPFARPDAATVAPRRERPAAPAPAAPAPAGPPASAGDAEPRAATPFPGHEPLGKERTTTGGETRPGEAGGGASRAGEVTPPGREAAPAARGETPAPPPAAARSELPVVTSPVPGAATQSEAAGPPGAEADARSAVPPAASSTPPAARTRPDAAPPPSPEPGAKAPSQQTVPGSVGRGGGTRGRSPAAPSPAPDAGGARDARPQAKARVPDAAGPAASAAPGAPAGPAARDAARLTRAVDASGRLVVAERARAEQALEALLPRVEAVRVARRVERDLLLLDIVVPRARYAELAAGLAGIGAWQLEYEAPTLPAQVRVEIAIGPTP
jgi:hypothetical protein